MEELNEQNTERPLSDTELRELREILEADRRMKWFWASARRITIWAAAIAGSISVGWEALVKFVMHIAGK